MYIEIKTVLHPMTLSEPLDKSRSALYFMSHVEIQKFLREQSFWKERMLACSRPRQSSLLK